MTIFLTVFVFLVIFSLLILIHECGHFFAAKRAGVRVEEFGFGLPPRLWGIKKGETLYSLNWIPFGGFVRMLGEDSSTKLSRSSPRSFSNQPLRTQAFIVCAGVLMNLLLAFLLLTIGFIVGIEPLMTSEEDFINEIRKGTVKVEAGKVGEVEEAYPLYLPRLTYLENPDSVFFALLEDGAALIQVEGKEILSEEDLTAALYDHREVALTFYREEVGKKELTIILPAAYPIIGAIEEASPAQNAGLQVGDQILSIDGRPISTAKEVTVVTREESADKVLEYEILRGEQRLSFTLVPRAEDRRIGIAVSEIFPYYGNLSLFVSYIPHTLMSVESVRYGWASPVVALKEMGRLSKVTAVMFGKVLREFMTGGEVPEGVSGPVGIAQMTFSTVQAGFAALIRFVALLSLSLGVINILPIPALDGGKLFFIVVQGITGKKLSSHYENLIHLAGFFFLIIFLVYVTFNDVLNLF